MEWREIQKLTPEQCVSNGVECLDAHFGNSDWVSRIDLQSFDIGSISNCILGQLFNSYSDGIEILDLDNDYTDRHMRGFGSGNHDCQEVWVEELGKLLRSDGGCDE